MGESDHKDKALVAIQGVAKAVAEMGAQATACGPGAVNAGAILAAGGAIALSNLALVHAQLAAIQVTERSLAFWEQCKLEEDIRRRG